MGDIWWPEPEGEEREARGRPGVVSEVLMASHRTSGFYLSEVGNDWSVLSRIMTSYNLSYEKINF